MNARTLTIASVLGLFALVLAWHLVLNPPRSLPPWVAVVLHALPLLPSLVLLARRRRSAGFWGALAALFLFCHGVTEAWISPATRALAFVEIALCVTLIFAASWNGLRARLEKRRATRGAAL